jgi:hypothetical protein
LWGASFPRGPASRIMHDVDALRMIAAAAVSWMSAVEWATRTMRYRRGTRKQLNRIIIRSI